MWESGECVLVAGGPAALCGNVAFGDRQDQLISYLPQGMPRSLSCHFSFEAVVSCNLLLHQQGDTHHGKRQFVAPFLTAFTSTERASRLAALSMPSAEVLIPLLIG